MFPPNQKCGVFDSFWLSQWATQVPKVFLIWYPRVWKGVEVIIIDIKIISRIYRGAVVYF